MPFSVQAEVNLTKVALRGCAASLGLPALSIRTLITIKRIQPYAAQVCTSLCFVVVSLMTRFLFIASQKAQSSATILKDWVLKREFSQICSKEC